MGLLVDKEDTVAKVSRAGGTDMGDNEVVNAGKLSASGATPEVYESSWPMPSFSAGNRVRVLPVMGRGGTRAQLEGVGVFRVGRSRAARRFPPAYRHTRCGQFTTLAGVSIVV